MACGVDGDQPHAHRVDGAGGRPLHPGAGRHGSDHPRLRTGTARQDGRIDPHDAAQPDLPGPRRGRHERPELARTVRRGRPRPDRLQPRHHRGRPASGRAVRGRRARHRRRPRVGRSPARPDPATGSARLPLRATDRPSRSARAQGAPADGAPGDRAGCDTDHVHRRDRPRDDGRRRCAGRLQLRLRDPPDPTRDHRGPARHRRPPVTVTECSRRRGGIIRDASHPGVAACSST